MKDLYFQFKNYLDHLTYSGFSIEFDETELNEIEDTYNANIEVFVTLEDGFTVIGLNDLKAKINKLNGLEKSTKSD